MERMFRYVRADEVECRVATVKLPDGNRKGGVSLLLYKDARVDQNILDETVGPMNWQRQHTRDNANCIVALWDDTKKQWISKEDTGTESNTEAEKGLASDSFKRACFNWGIGRELYTAPFIWVSSDDCKVYEAKGKGACSDRFDVTKLTVDDGKITQLEIKNMTTRKVVFTFGSNPVNKKEPEQKDILKNDLLEHAKKAKITEQKLLKLTGLETLDGIDTETYERIKTALIQRAEMVKQLEEQRNGTKSEA